MKAHGRSVQWLVVFILIAGCASTSVTNRQVLVNQKLPRPNRIMVYDFIANPAEVPLDAAIAGQYEIPPTPPSPEDLQAGQQLGALIADELVTRIRDMGLPGLHALRGTPPQIDDIVIRGYLISVQAGSAGKRMLIGFGAGASELKTVVEGYQMTALGLRKLGSGTVDSGGNKGPGAVVPAAVAIATANPIGLIVTGGIKIYGEASGRSKLEGRAKATANEIADVLHGRFEEQGWIK